MLSGCVMLESLLLLPASEKSKETINLKAQNQYGDQRSNVCM